MLQAAIFLVVKLLVVCQASSVIEIFKITPTQQSKFANEYAFFHVDAGHQHIQAIKWTLNGHNLNNVGIVYNTSIVNNRAEIIIKRIPLQFVRHSYSLGCVLELEGTPSNTIVCMSSVLRVQAKIKISPAQQSKFPNEDAFFYVDVGNYQIQSIIWDLDMRIIYNAYIVNNRAEIIIQRIPLPFGNYSLGCLLRLVDGRQTNNVLCASSTIHFQVRITPSKMDSRLNESAVFLIHTGSSLIQSIEWSYNGIKEVVSSSAFDVGLALLKLTKIFVSGTIIIGCKLTFTNMSNPINCIPAILQVADSIRAIHITPPNGTKIYEVYGARLRFSCSVVSQDTSHRFITNWKMNGIDIDSAIGLQNVKFTGSATLSHPFGHIVTTRNILILSEFNFNNITLTCENGGNVFSQYYLFLHQPVSLRNFTTFSVLYGTRNVSINMEKNMSFTASPFPASFTWQFNGRPVESISLVTFSYPTVTFHFVEVSLSGVYSLSATNYVGDSNQISGNGFGTFRLDVLFGPSLRRGDIQRTVKLGDSVSLLCGTHLLSYPAANISWQNPEGRTIRDESRYNFIYGANEVRLNILTTNQTDNGNWKCILSVTAHNVITSPYTFSIPELKVGRLEYDIKLFIVESSSVNLGQCSKVISLIDNASLSQPIPINISEVNTCFVCSLPGQFLLNSVPFFYNNRTVTIEPQMLIIRFWRDRYLNLRLEHTNVIECTSGNGSIHINILNVDRCSQLILLSGDKSSYQANLINTSQITTCFMCSMQGQFYLNNALFVSNHSITIKLRKIIVHSWRGTNLKLDSINFLSCRTENTSSSISFYTSTPAQLVITKELSAIEGGVIITEGSNLTIRCSNINQYPLYSGTPSWINVDGEDTGLAELVITMAEPSDAGMYKCRVPHVTSIPTKKFTITVNFSPTLTCAGSAFQLLDIGTELILMCAYDGSPIPDVIWMLNNSLVDTLSPNITTTSVTHANRKKVSRLRWKYLTSNSKGTYVIRASNKLGTAETQFEIQIATPPDPPKVSIARTQISHNSSVQLFVEPGYDGMSPILGYYVAFQIVGKENYISREFNKEPVIDLFSLQPASHYMINVSARNRLGLSGPTTVYAVTNSDIHGTKNMYLINSFLSCIVFYIYI